MKVGINGAGMMAVQKGCMGAALLFAKAGRGTAGDAGAEEAKQR